ncbi:hypothetical protein EX30DRAFT_337174 [Ascodesmis nigricans]|uniref:DAGKc domain-containing protein n=1 Tax=Ascodesmis nigricans TaxID=341454 RepID=A0A4S2N5Z8_9PEZI|nr:hypothetical protein EX30DRAFT_337174 [Ascodesmis nigricans]
MPGANHHTRHVLNATLTTDGITLTPPSSSSSSSASSSSSSSSPPLPQSVPVDDSEIDNSLHVLWSSIVCLLPPTNDDGGDEDDHGNSIYTLLYTSASPLELNRCYITSPPPSLFRRYLFHSLPPQLDSSISDVHVLVSTASGGACAISYNSYIVQPLFEELRISSETSETTSATSISECMTAWSSRPRPQTVLLLSGDTGIYDAINAPIASSNITLAIFPLGTGNAFASSAHLSRGYSPLAALLFGTAHSIPTFRARFSPGSRWASTGTPVPDEGIIGAVVISWGFHAALVADSESLRGAGVGVERFKIAAEQNLQPVHQYRGRLSILPPNGDSWRAIQSTISNGVLSSEDPGARDPPGDPHFYALATMCSNLEEAFRISPGSRLGERAIRVVHFPPMEESEVMSLMGGAYQGGTHVDDDRVGYEVARGLRIEMCEEDERWRRVCVDGGTVVLPRDGWVECEVMREEEIGMKALWID